MLVFFWAKTVRSHYTESAPAAASDSASRAASVSAAASGAEEKRAASRSLPFHVYSHTWATPGSFPERVFGSASGRPRTARRSCDKALYTVMFVETWQPTIRPHPHDYWCRSGKKSTKMKTYLAHSPRICSLLAATLSWLHSDSPRSSSFTGPRGPASRAQTSGGGHHEQMPIGLYARSTSTPHLTFDFEHLADPVLDETRRSLVTGR